MLYRVGTLLSSSRATGEGGSNNGGGQHLNTPMKWGMYLPRLMSNAELQTVTT